eukprot:scaffold24174_cov127-Isochrysis_galbana.AAC.6
MRDRPRSLITCSGLVGETWPKRLALGAATGIPAAAMSCRARAWEGHRTPTAPVPAESRVGKSAAMGATIVSGPGQKSAASARKRSSASGDGIASSGSASTAVATWTMSGSVLGRPFTSKMRPSAVAFRASAPRPYTVSVGKATSSPPTSSSAASVTLSRYRPSMGELLSSAAAPDAIANALRHRRGAARQCCGKRRMRQGRSTAAAAVEANAPITTRAISFFPAGLFVFYYSQPLHI